MTCYLEIQLLFWWQRKVQFSSDAILSPAVICFSWSLVIRLSINSHDLDDWKLKNNWLNIVPWFGDSVLLCYCVCVVVRFSGLFPIRWILCCVQGRLSAHFLPAALRSQYQQSLGAGWDGDGVDSCSVQTIAGCIRQWEEHIASDITKVNLYPFLLVLAVQQVFLCTNSSIEIYGGQSALFQFRHLWECSKTISCSLLYQQFTDLGRTYGFCLVKGTEVEIISLNIIHLSLAIFAILAYMLLRLVTDSVFC